MRPGCDLSRPYGRGDELGRDDKCVPAMPVADQLGDRRERGSALAGAERGDQKRGVALVEIGRGALLIGAQDAGGKGAFIYLLTARSSLCVLVRRRSPPIAAADPRPSPAGSASRARSSALASAARASSTSMQISSCVVMRIGMNASAGFVSIRVTVARKRSAATA